MNLGMDNRIWLAVMAGVFVVVAACGESSSSTGTVSLEPALEATVDDAVIPTMEDFADAATSLEAQAASLCPDPSESKVLALQDEWLAMAQVWNRAAVYFLGPLDDDVISPTMIFIESMRQRGTDYTETVRTTIADAVEGSDTLDGAFFEALQFNRVGILALESLLFEDHPRTPGSNEPTDIVDGYAASERKCEVLEGMATLLATRARAVESGWTTDFGETGSSFRDLLLTGQLDDGSLPVPAILLATVDYLEYIQLRKLDGILDAALATAARPDQSPFWANLMSGLDEIEAVMEPPGADTGFFDVMAQRGFESSVELVRANLAAARATVEDEDREAAFEAFSTLENNFRREVPTALGVNLGINFSDGD